MRLLTPGLPCPPVRRCHGAGESFASPLFPEHPTPQAKISLMENFRDFEVGPDPFGQTWHAQFKYLQTAISIRHSDSVDVRYILESGSERIQKTVVIQNADIRAYAKRTGRPVSDAWCSRIAMCKLKQVIETAEDIDR